MLFTTTVEAELTWKLVLRVETVTSTVGDGIVNCSPGKDEVPLLPDDTSMAFGLEDPRMIVDSPEELSLGGGLAMTADEPEVAAAVALGL